VAGVLLLLQQLSPDGKYLAYVRPSGPNDVYNVFIKALPGPGQVTAAAASTSLFEKEGVAKDKQVRSKWPDFKSLMPLSVECWVLS
jgi:hypothetical protein